MAAALASADGGGEKAPHEAGIAIAKFYAENYLTEATGLAAAVTAGASATARIDPALLTA